MRVFKKYKNFSKQSTLLRTIPLTRVLKFKRTKWLKVQKLCALLFKPNSKELKGKILHDNLLISSQLGQYTNLTRYFSEGIYLKRIIMSFFDNRITVANYKKLLFSSGKHLTYKDQYLISMIKPFFYIEILLWKLGLFSSCYEILQLMQSGLILINDKPAFYSVLVKKHDVISFNSNISFLNDYQLKMLLVSLVEIDFYTQQIILLKDFNDITEVDAALFMSEALEINSFLNYIANK